VAGVDLEGISGISCLGFAGEATLCLGHALHTARFLAARGFAREGTAFLSLGARGSGWTRALAPRMHESDVERRSTGPAQRTVTGLRGIRPLIVQ
jgi:hypothetical protein